MITTREFINNYDQVKDLLYGFALKLTKNQSDAQDLIQDTSLKAFKNLDKFREGTNFKAWVTTIMRNAYINKYRSKKRKKHVSGPLEDYTYDLESSSDSLADTNIIASELNTIVEELKDTYRIPFIKAFNGYKYDEIADHLDIPLGTVKSRINYARKILREKVSYAYAAA